MIDFTNMITLLPKNEFDKLYYEDPKGTSQKVIEEKKAVIREFENIYKTRLDNFFCNITSKYHKDTFRYIFKSKTQEYKDIKTFIKNLADVCDILIHTDYEKRIECLKEDISDKKSVDVSQVKPILRTILKHKWDTDIFTANTNWDYLMAEIDMMTYRFNSN